MDPNSLKTIEEFVNGMIEVDKKLKELNPDYIIAPMMGAVPLIDVLHIIDPELSIGQIEYMPASNKIHNVRRVIRDWFDHFLQEVYDPKGLTIVGVDEVVSGNSVVRAYKQIKASIDSKIEEEVHKHLALYNPAILQEKGNTYRSELRDELSKKIKYISLGVKDSKMSKTGKFINPEYQKLVEEMTAIPIEVGSIVTMDRQDFFPATYKTAEKEGKTIFLPVVEKFDVSPAYIDFLRVVAGIVGKDQNQISMVNMYRILESSRFISKELKTTA